MSDCALYGVSAVTALPLLAFAALQVAIEGTVRLTTPHLDSLDVFVRSAPELEKLAADENARIFTGDPLLFWRLAPDLDRCDLGLHAGQHQLAGTAPRPRRRRAPPERSAHSLPRRLGASVPRVGRDAYVRNVSEMVALAEQHAVDAIVIGGIYRDLETMPEAARQIVAYRTALRAEMGRREHFYLEINQLTERGAPGNRELFGEAIHPNHLGHRLVALELLRFMHASHLLPGWNIPELDERQLGIPIATQRRAIYRSTS